MNMKARIFPILALACLSLSSCLSYDADEFTGRIMPRVASYTSGVTNDWIYFNLRTGEVFNRTAPNQEIKEGEQKNRLDWDIAFCGYHVRTNSGTSGNGKGGAIDLGYGDYDRWQHIDQLPKGQGWVVDDDKTVKITYSQSDWFRYVNTHGLDPKENPWFDPNNGPQRTLTSANPLLERNMFLSGPPMTYTPSYHVYAVRTADGKHYFKLQIISWYNQHTEIDDTGGQMSYYCDELKQ
ncbi:hypothetical protein HMPREF1199_00726 [Hoylesella oralis CC98A]|nr:hypothetical protein HMPREF1199_00726 [Hoylesella oralis CC98A]